MTMFISNCECNGVGPEKQRYCVKEYRENLVCRLMSQRNVVRMICGPDGYGKSCLAFQYASIVFSFKNVFWIDAKSPCFFRDLDRNIIFSDIYATDNNVKLVVFDNIIDLNDDRLKILSETIDQLLHHECEVIITAIPEYNTLLRYQQDAYVLNSHKLLMKKISNGIKIDKYSDNEKKLLKKIYSIPIYSNNIHSTSSLLKYFISEGHTECNILSIFMIYILNKGSLNIIKQFLSKSEFKLLELVSREYIHFGIDLENNLFCVPEVSPLEVINIFNDYLDVIYKRLDCCNKNELFLMLANILLKNKQYTRAYDLIYECGNQESKCQFYKNNEINSLKFLYISQQAKAYEQNKVYLKETYFYVLHLLRLCFLGKSKFSFKLIYNLIQDKSCDDLYKIIVLFIFLYFGNKEEMKHSYKIIKLIIKNNDWFTDNPELIRNNKLCNNIDFLKFLINLCDFSSLNKVDYDEIFNNNKFNKNQKMLALVIFLKLSCKNKITFNKIEVINNLITFVREYLDTIENNYEFNFLVYLLVDNFLDFYKKYKNIENINSIDLDNEIISKYFLYKKQHEKQIREFNKYFTTIEKENRFKDFDFVYEQKIKTSINKNIKISNSEIKQSKIPIMTIKVIGGLELKIDEKSLNQKDFSRQKLKVLLCILILEKGREVNKDKLSKLIWPESDHIARVSNINAHWSTLYNKLILKDGKCPYLIRNQNSYNINNKIVKTDIEELERFCAELTLGPVDPFSWWKQMELNDCLFNGDLLPSENKNQYIIQKREELKNKVVDALSAASQRLYEIGEYQQALWFANKALCKDDSREDIYISLMKCQIKMGQRTSAMQTYYACKKYLDSNLGIYPSRKISSLYNDLVSDCC